VAVAVRREDGKWLMVRRSRKVGSPLKVCFPGGTVEAGESQEQAVVREMWEELAVKVRPVKQVWMHQFPDKPLTLFGWIAELENEAELKINEEEIAEVFWMDAGEGSSHPDGMATNRHFIACLEDHR
jgi:mutator protein MutT